MFCFVNVFGSENNGYSDDSDHVFVYHLLSPTQATARPHWCAASSQLPSPASKNSRGWKHTLSSLACNCSAWHCSSVLWGSGNYRNTMRLGFVLAGCGMYILILNKVLQLSVHFLLGYFNKLELGECECGGSREYCIMYFPQSCKHSLDNSIFFCTESV